MLPCVHIGFYSRLAILLYPLQMYADFSGCMDIVLGTSELFGIKLAENFNNPFFKNFSRILAEVAHYPWNMGKRLCFISFIEIKAND